MDWHSRLLMDWRKASPWDQISWFSAIATLILMLIGALGWMREHMSLYNFFIISYIMLMITSISAIYANVLRRRECDNLNQNLGEEIEKAQDAVKAVYDFKNKEMEDYRKKITREFSEFIEHLQGKRRYVKGDLRLNWNGESVQSLIEKLPSDWEDKAEEVYKLLKEG